MFPPGVKVLGRIWTVAIGATTIYNYKNLKLWLCQSPFTASSIQSCSAGTTLLPSSPHIYSTSFHVRTFIFCAFYVSRLSRLLLHFRFNFVRVSISLLDRLGWLKLTRRRCPTFSNLSFCVYDSSWRLMRPFGTNADAIRHRIPDLRSTYSRLEQWSRRRW